MSECTSITSNSGRKGKNLISRIKNGYAKWNFIKDNLYKIKAFKLIPIIYDEVGKRTFEKYIERHENVEEIKKYWDGFVLCKKIQKNNFLINRPGIINQTLKYTASYKTKKEIAQILFDYEIDNDIIAFNLFLYRWENNLIQNMQESKVCENFLTDKNRNTKIFERILTEIFKELKKEDEK